MTHAITVPLTARNATLPDLAELLQRQHAAKHDLVASVGRIHAKDGNLIIDGAEPVIDLDGVSTVPGLYVPTSVCDGGISEKLGIPGAYLRRMRAEATDLYDANVNGWLNKADQSTKYLVRTFSDRDGGSGIARAFLSDSYKIVDSLDVLLAALDGIRRSGLDVTIDSCDLTDRRMIVRVYSEQVRSIAPALLRNYRSPFTGATGADNPIVFAGFVLSNSETGGGRFNLVPQIKVQVCNNGMTITKDALSKTHLGAKLDEGIIRWSDGTQQKNIELITSQASDFAKTFLSPEYVAATIAEIEKTAGRPVEDPEKTVKAVSQRLRFTEDQQKNIFSHFIKGADLTAGGVMHAVTSVAQTLDDADDAYEMENVGLKAMEIAASL
ncbi:DUF932 domain-containing protein [Dactylosporangium sp. NPDC050688]|uniref:DUF932 domain-containing protein n=1 Tax=Dactylosporangium sp. NPDC050688 TaxID=3157217 RepID=UPI0033F9723C